MVPLLIGGLILTHIATWASCHALPRCHHRRGSTVADDAADAADAANAPRRDMAREPERHAKSMANNDELMAKITINHGYITIFNHGWLRTLLTIFNHY